MKNKEIKQQLKTEAANFEVPDVLAELKQAGISKDRQEPQPRPSKRFNYKALLPVAAVLVFVFVFPFAILPGITGSIAANVKIEIGVSVELVVNKNDFVTGYGDGDNSDSLINKAAMLNKPIDEVIEEIITEAKAKGYLDGNETEIAVEVVCRNRSRKNKLQKKIASCINQSCQRNGGKAKMR